jgi:hypothetical protein
VTSVFIMSIGFGVWGLGCSVLVRVRVSKWVVGAMGFLPLTLSMVLFDILCLAFEIRTWVLVSVWKNS